LKIFEEEILSVRAAHSKRLVKMIPFAETITRPWRIWWS